MLLKTRLPSSIKNAILSKSKLACIFISIVSLAGCLGSSSTWEDPYLTEKKENAPQIENCESEITTVVTHGLLSDTFKFSGYKLTCSYADHLDEAQSLEDIAEVVILGTAQQVSLDFAGFNSLRALSITNKTIQALHLSTNTHLDQLTIEAPLLTTLSLPASVLKTHFTDLSSLATINENGVNLQNVTLAGAASTELVSFITAGNTEYLSLDSPHIRVQDFYGLDSLVRLRLSRFTEEQLDVSPFPALSTITYLQTSLPHLQLEASQLQVDISIIDSDIGTVNLSLAPNVDRLSMSNSAVDTLDASDLSNLTSLFLHDVSMVSIDLSRTPRLSSVSILKSNLINLDLSETSATWVELKETYIENLMLHNEEASMTLNVYSHKASHFNITGGAGVNNFVFTGNQNATQSLIFNDMLALETLSFEGLDLTSLNLKPFSLLAKFSIFNATIERALLPSYFYEDYQSINQLKYITCDEGADWYKGSVNTTQEFAPNIFCRTN